jgi:hypothetical protein
MFLIGCAHPAGESDSYDGLYYKQCELKQLANDLIGKPVLFNHEPDCRVGTIVSAWEGETKPGKMELYTFIELDQNTLNGNLAKHSIIHGLLKDLSLGHSVQIEHSADRTSQHVVAKEPREVSLCVEGARPNTHIFCVALGDTSANTTKYINTTPVVLKCHGSKMSTTQDVPSSIEQNNESSKIQLTHSVLMQLKDLQERNKKLESDLAHYRGQSIDELNETNKRLTEDLEKYKNNSKRLRQEALNNGVRDYIFNIMKEHPELTAYQEEMQNNVNAMADAENATGMVKFLEACASKKAQNVVELEKLYQEQKRKDEQIQQLQSALNVLQTDGFSLASERMCLASNNISEQPPQKRLKTTNSSSTASFAPNNDLFREIEQMIKSSGSANKVPTMNPNDFGFQRRLFEEPGSTAN